MDGFGPDTYGESFADVYDRWYGDLPGLRDTVEATWRLAEGGAVLELACGTGRLLLPLAARGVTVHGLDSSPSMLARLHAKHDELRAVTDAGGAVVTHHGDMADFDLPDAPRFRLVFLAFNSLFNLPSARHQQDCFRAVARHLSPGGRFAVECVLVAEQPSGVHDAVELHSIAADRVVLRVSRQDAAGQTVTGQHIEISEGGIRLRPWFLRYAGLEQLDAMAATAGFRLEHRHADWAGNAFDVDATHHVSIYRLGRA